MLQPHRRVIHALLLGVALMFTRLDHALAQEPAGSIEKLIADGWEVAGYIAVQENRSLILFKHKTHNYLVQCSVLIDVMRKPRMVTYCYDLK
jgi:hypothetical protein